MFYVALGAIVGGRVGYMFIYGLSELISDPLSILKVWEGGMSFHGGFAGVLVAMWLYARAITPAVLRRHGLRRAMDGDRTVRGAHRQLHQRRAVG